ncbi:bifunctional 5,10-methylenetetrahydrofolate dehydrogenase/5,10-methenyltetrahydrofolate cyclohydrolase [Clostridium perfringens]|jgi:methylenetetrahydrofolate dehydrogenase (NADP+)/methenyltetrahydrofolate cyclohydrolase|uniref:Bifunctional protein FolD n=1 Tax=Clostridium perfringens TaxID=1502 RepID=A0AAW4IY12_CLOPF|nr:bifunctional 5,10-methylenetetrahydrofolate dehydrogenase/5,10-methenyltetrahydrofolate cyclohydrolase [Clostridium perfringens]MBO3356151.1 bifunctional 5,10-methylenetetrahydrofolate dehydrogenase/5,10-methenyltetrahydrofolate cyclohydrolase [Clostridium perfringens]MBO3359508.1 bifunctional 5,10-methylenetetrahydrofolate dehydrogenase/5,10-methenyltetrahydrofolate cyclohydrolase [Clostridium perfringens]
MIIDCKKIREEIKQELKKRDLSNIKGIFIQVGDNQASNVYVRNKCKLCEELGIDYEHMKLDDSVSEEELLNIIDMLNKTKCVTGIMVQLPLPKHISEEKVIDAIDPNKDIDGFTNVNKGKLMIGDETGIIPCTPKGIITVLEHENIDIEGKNVVIVGRSNIVGKPLAQLLINKGATVTVCNSKTDRDVLKQQIILSDIFISAIGQPNYFNKSFFMKNDDNFYPEFLEDIIAIDVGINRDENNKLCGDISKDIYDYFDGITPVPGGIGLLTVLEVVRNLIKCGENN